MSIERNNRSRKLGRKVLAGALGVTGALLMGAMPAKAGFTGPGTFCTPGPTPSLTISNAYVFESNQTGYVQVNLSNPACWTVTVQYAAVNDTAGNGSDFDLPPGTLTFKPGQTVKHIVFPVTKDGHEGPEQFFINLSNPSGATIADGSSTVHIEEV